MGTHPIFESDFDCLTENSAQINSEMVQRLTYRRTLSYNTSSNNRKIVKTPGGKLVYQRIGKKAKVPVCGDTGNVLRGIKAGRPRQMAQYSKRQKTVTRSYGGSLCGAAVRSRIIRAFLIEEQKIVVKVLKAKQQAANASK